MKRIAQHVMGCRLNHAEAEKVRAAFCAAGWDVSTDADRDSAAPDAYHLHSCAVTARAQREAVRRIRAAARAGTPEIVVSGCVANLPEGAAALAAAGATDVVSRHDGPNASGGGAVARVVRATLFGKPGGGDNARATAAKQIAAPRATRTPVKIQDGCDARCAYCIVPDARGTPRSLPLPAVLDACRAAVADGPREIVLTGVNTARWNDGSLRLADAARAVAAIPGVLRVRLASVEPDDSEVPRIAALMAELGVKICHTLHLPLQSGSDSILRAMRRNYAAEGFRASVREALALVPDLGLGTDVITGFPGESDADFAATMAVLEELPFSNVHVFPYSERPGTPAATMPGAVPVVERRRRAKTIAELAARKRAQFAASFVGKTVEILAEAEEEGGVSGWTGQYLRAVVRNAPHTAVGGLLRARVITARGANLLCE